MRFILVSISLIYLIISAYGVDESDEDVAACMKETPGLSGSTAKTLIDPKTKPKTKDDMCFVECYYKRKSPSLSGDYETEVDDKPYNITLEDRTKNTLFKQCIEHAKYEKSACILGLVTRRCHQQLSRLSTQVIGAILDSIE